MRPDAPDHNAIDDLARQIFPRACPLLVTPMAEGVSTRVYRVQRGDDVFYLRVLPEEDASFAPEAWVHEALRKQSARVPEVVYFEHRNQALQRSVMVTTAIAGQSLGRIADVRLAGEIMIEAGRDLAIINSVPVQGFGWIARDSDSVTHLEADYHSARQFVLDGLGDDLALLATHVLHQDEAAALEHSLRSFHTWLDAERAWLAHGDFDLTHIYHQGGRYTGIIDFGETRGTPPLYDLGHFRMHDGETVSMPLLGPLLKGYGQVAPLPPDHERQITFASLFIAARALSRQLQKPPPRAPAHWLTSLRRDLAALRPG